MSDNKTNNSSNGQINTPLGNNSVINNQNTRPVNNNSLNSTVRKTQMSRTIDKQTNNTVNQEVNLDGNSSSTINSNQNKVNADYEIGVAVSRQIHANVSSRPVFASDTDSTDAIDNENEESLYDNEGEVLDDEGIDDDSLEDDISQDDNDDGSSEEVSDDIDEEESDEIDTLDNEDETTGEEIEESDDENNTSSDEAKTGGEDESEEKNSEPDGEDEEKSEKDDQEPNQNDEVDEKEKTGEDKTSNEENQSPNENPSGDNQQTSENDSDAYKSTSTPETGNNEVNQDNQNAGDNPSESSKEEKEKGDYTPEEVNNNQSNFRDYQNQQNRYNQEAAARNNYQQTNTRNPNQQDGGVGPNSGDSSGDGLPKKDDENNKDSSDKNKGEKKDSKDKKDTKSSKNEKDTKKKKSDNSKKLKAKSSKKKKEELEKKKKELLLKYWWVIGLVIIVFLLFFVILLAILGGEESDDYSSLIDPEYDFSLTVINVTNDYSSSGDRVVLETVSLMDYLEGAAYAQFGNSLDGKSDSEKMAIYEAFYVAAKSILLSLGNYDASTKEITIRSGVNGMPYCDVNAGCKIYNNNGVYSYVSTNVKKSVKGDLTNTMSALSDHEITLMNVAYTVTKPMLLVPKDYNGLIEKYDFAKPPYNNTIRDKMISSSETEYQNIISSIEEYKNFKIYSLADYAMSYEFTENTAYWWPIGSSSPTSGNIYGGTPTATNVTSKFGWRDLNGDGKAEDYHQGIDIANGSCTSVIVATRSGTVIKAAGGCETKGYLGSNCNYGYGNYVKIDHGNGVVTVYAHLTKDSIVVKEGQTVAQGQKIGIMGSSGSSTGCHLHFGIEIDGNDVDPLQYITAANPRPSAKVEANYQNGSDNKQSVCLTLKQSGFSDNAVAAIMTNIQAESSFRTGAIGDSGTSYGLCQWHNGRYTNLKKYCGSDYSTVNCQLRFLIYELQGSYPGVYKMLLSNNSAYDMASYYCINFEIPANRYENCPKRASNYSASMLSYVKNGCK